MGNAMANTSIEKTGAISPGGPGSLRPECDIPVKFRKPLIQVNRAPSSSYIMVEEVPRNEFPESPA